MWLHFSVFVVFGYIWDSGISGHCNIVSISLLSIEAFYAKAMLHYLEGMPHHVRNASCCSINGTYIYTYIYIYYTYYIYIYINYILYDLLYIYIFINYILYVIYIYYIICYILFIIYCIYILLLYYMLYIYYFYIMFYVLYILYIYKFICIIYIYILLYIYYIIRNIIWKILLYSWLMLVAHIISPVVHCEIQDSPAGAHKAHEAHGLREDDYNEARSSAARPW